jgi:hypothetical protein
MGSVNFLEGSGLLALDTDWGSFQFSKIVRDCNSLINTVHLKWIAWIQPYKHSK